MLQQQALQGASNAVDNHVERNGKRNTTGKQQLVRAELRTCLFDWRASYLYRISRIAYTSVSYNKQIDTIDVSYALPDVAAGWVTHV